MKVLVIIARILLGLMFFVFGLNPFLKFIPAILPPGPGAQFLALLTTTHYVMFVGAFQVIGGALLLVNRYVPLALTILGPIIVNILLYHLLLEHAGYPLALLATILWMFLAYRNRQYFASLFVQKTAA